jgi:pimeloyl-ACP methyl ester carboxylesterase
MSDGSNPPESVPTGSEDGEQREAPPWFRAAIAQAPEHHETLVDGTRVHYRAWGDPSLPGLVLVHGGAAHSGWWDHIAPQLTSHRVVALDLSGHGDSGRRTSYGLDTWSDEVLGVAEAAALTKPVIVGHSMGGWVSVSVGSRSDAGVSAVAVLDSPLNDQPPEESRLRDRIRPHRVYPSVEQAMTRFATLPPQDLVLPYVRDHMGPQSLRPVEGGWSWKFDPTMFGRRALLRELLPKLSCPAAMFRSEHGLVTAQMVSEMARLIPDRFAVVDVPAAGHHPMLDQPLALVTGLRTLLALWPTPSPAAVVP